MKSKHIAAVPKGAAELRAVAVLLKAATPIKTEIYSTDDVHGLLFQAFENIIDFIVIPALDEKYKEPLHGLSGLFAGGHEDVSSIPNETLKQIGRLIDLLVGEAL